MAFAGAIGAPFDEPVDLRGSEAGSLLFSFEALRDTIKRLPSSIFRCKGIVHTTEDPTPYVIQSVGRRSTFTRTDPDVQPDGISRIVVIGAAGILGDAGPQAQFDRCMASPGPLDTQNSSVSDGAQRIG